MNDPAIVMAAADERLFCFGLALFFIALEENLFHGFLWKEGKDANEEVDIEAF